MSWSSACEDVYVLSQGLQLLASIDTGGFGSRYNDYMDGTFAAPDSRTCLARAPAGLMP